MLDTPANAPISTSPCDVLTRFGVALLRCDRHGRILGSADGAWQLLGSTASAPIVGTVLWNWLADPDERKRLAEALQAGERIPPLLVRLMVQGSAGPTLSLTAEPADTPGEFDVLLRSGTEEQALRDRVGHLQRLDVVGHLTCGVAHDFNNILCAIVSFSSFARDQAPAGSPIRDDLAEVLAAAERAVALTRQLLSLSRGRASAARRVDPNELIEGLAKLLRRLLPTSIELSIQLGEDVGTVHIDPGNFEQVLLNLAINARDAMPDGGTLTIATGVVGEPTTNVATDGEACWTRVLVRDTGAGMTPEVLRRCLDPFFTTKGPERGTGLGLTSCAETIRAAGGQLRIESTPGTGTSCTLLLPHDESPSDFSADTWTDSLVYQVGDERVLVVDDDPGVLATTARVLERAGYSVQAVSHGEEALRWIASGHTVDLVVTDLVMPVMGGVELCQRLRKHMHRLSFLYMSGYVERSALRAAVWDTHARFLQKPFRAEALLREVRELLDGAACDSAGRIGPVRQSEGIQP